MVVQKCQDGIPVFQKSFLESECFFMGWIYSDSKQFVQLFFYRC